ncbi:hypothetical protein Tco_0822501 [Tanacetum coccineum]|uniref:Uncharacterized protein n=1 Tax=Tanacetum coccineum TaxID=301880 RepID=A0ABQ5AIF0_9ASTR
MRVREFKAIEFVNSFSLDISFFSNRSRVLDHSRSDRMVTLAFSSVSGRLLRLVEEQYDVFLSRMVLDDGCHKVYDRRQSSALDSA